MDFAQLKELLQLVNQSDLREFELNTGQLAVRMSKNDHPPAAQLTNNGKKEPVEIDRPIEQAYHVPVPQSFSSDEAANTPESPVQEEGYVLEAPIVGVVYLSPSPDKPAFKKAGDSVEKGESLCIIEAMKVMNEIKSDRDGTIQEILVEDGQAIEYGQPLFRIKEEE